MSAQTKSKGLLVAPRYNRLTNGQPVFYTQAHKQTNTKYQLAKQPTHKYTNTPTGLLKQTHCRGGNFAEEFLMRCNEWWLLRKYTNTQIHKYTNTQIQILKYEYTNTNTQIQIHKYTNTAYDEVPEVPYMCYIFEQLVVQ